MTRSDWMLEASPSCDQCMATPWQRPSTAPPSSIVVSVSAYSHSHTTGGDPHLEGGDLFCWRTSIPVMTRTIELDDDLAERMEGHLEDGETLEEFIEELVAIYEQEGRFLQEGA